MTPDGMVATIRLFIKDESSFQVWKMKQKQKWPKPEFFTMSHRLGGGSHPSPLVGGEGRERWQT